MKKIEIEWHLIADGDYPTTAGEYMVTARTPWMDNFNDTDAVDVFIAEYHNKIAPEADRDLVLPNGYAFGEMWSDGMDNLYEAISWAEKPAPYTGDKA